MDTLEDDFTWVIRKAFKGLALAPGEAASRAGLPEKEVLAFSRGNFSAETARRLAPVLGLNADALASHNLYLPKPQAVPEIHRLNLPFGEERVNAWLVRVDGAAVLFDTGYEPGSCAMALDAIEAPVLDQVFVTHGHRDHTGGIASFIARGNIPYGADVDETWPMKAGDSITCGPLVIRACDLSGHFTPMLGFHIEGLGTPVLVTADALFAGSIGGCDTPALYQQALRNLRTALAPLPDDTILLPGHGPATTLAEERVANPFLCALEAI